MVKAHTLLHWCNLVKKKNIIVIFGFGNLLRKEKKNTKTMFGSQKILGKEKKSVKKNGFLIFYFTIKKYNIIKINLKFIYFKLFNLVVIERNK